MKKIALLLISSFIITSCISKKEKENNQSNEENIIEITEEVNKNDSSEHIVVTVSDRAPERIEKTEDFSPTELRTTRLKNGNLVTTFDIYLGTFEDETNYDLRLSFIRKSEETELKLGSYNLVAFGDGLKLQPKTESFFESTNTLNSETYDNIKLSGTLDDFPDDFYAPLNKDNIFVIESAEEPIETENSTNIISENFQRVKGYLIFNVVKIQSEKTYKIRVDFNIINEIRIMKN